MNNIIYKDESYAIMGACFEVYKEKGCGFLESVYQECLGIEFGLAGIPFQPQAELRLSYKGRPLDQFFKVDFACYQKIVVELKAVSKLAPEKSGIRTNSLLTEETTKYTKYTKYTNKRNKIWLPMQQVGTL